MRIDIGWAENQHVNFLLSLMSDAAGKDNKPKPMSNAALARAMV